MTPVHLLCATLCPSVTVSLCDCVTVSLYCTASSRFCQNLLRGLIGASSSAAKAPTDDPVYDAASLRRLFTLTSPPPSSLSRRTRHL